MTFTDDPRIGYGDGGERVHITLGPAATAKARVMAARERITIPELVRRALSLYYLWKALPPGAELMVKNPDGSLDRVMPIGAGGTDG